MEKGLWQKSLRRRERKHLPAMRVWINVLQRTQAGRESQIELARLSCVGELDQFRKTFNHERVPTEEALT